MRSYAEFRGRVQYPLSETVQWDQRPGILYYLRGAGVNHVGIVVDVTNDKANTIEGNSGDAVRRRSYKTW